jgi:hypothetical protein
VRAPRFRRVTMWSHPKKRNKQTKEMPNLIYKCRRSKTIDE